MSWALEAIEREAMRRAERDVLMRSDQITVAGLTVPQVVALIAAARVARDELRRRSFQLIDDADGDGALGRITRVLDEALAPHLGSSD